MRLPAFSEIIGLFREHPSELSPKKKLVSKRFSLDIDEDEHFYRKLSAGNKNDIPQNVTQKAIDLSIKFVTENSIAGRIISVPIEAMKSAGLTFVAKDKRTKALIDEFWGDEIFGFGKLFWDLYRGGMITGELHIPVHDLQYQASFDVAFVDTQNVVDVRFHPTNCLLREAIVVKTKDGKRELEIINKGPMIPPARYSGEVFSFFYNIPVVNFRRGIPTLFSSIDYIDLLEQYMFNETERSATLRTFIWEFILKGKTEAQCKEWYDSNFEGGKPPAPQSVHVHNENVEMRALSPELRAGEIKDFSRTLRNHITGGLGFPEFFFGWGDNTNVATAREQNLPLSWKVETEQDVFKNTLSTIIAYRVLTAKRNRFITKAGIMTPDTDTSFEIVMKPVIPRDLARYASVLSTILNVMTTAIDKKLLTRRIAIEQACALLENFGTVYDPNVIEAELDKEIEKNSKPTKPAGPPEVDDREIQDRGEEMDRNGNLFPEDILS